MGLRAKTQAHYECRISATFKVDESQMDGTLRKKVGGTLQPGPPTSKGVGTSFGAYREPPEVPLSVQPLTGFLSGLRVAPSTRCKYTIGQPSGKQKQHYTNVKIARSFHLKSLRQKCMHRDKLCDE